MTGLKSAGLSVVLACFGLPTQAQTALANPVVPLLEGVRPAPDCGNLYDLAGKAFCVTAPLSGMEAAGKAYIAHLEGEGWLVADGNDRRVVFIRRRDGGGCDALQMLAYFDRSLPDEATTPGYLAFSTIPGDACATAPTAPQTDQ